MEYFSHLRGPGPDKQAKNIIFLLVGNSVVLNGTSANYYATNDHEIYVICNFVVYSRFIESVIAKDLTRNVTVITAYTSYQDLFRLTKILHGIGSNERKQTYRNQWIERHHQFMSPQDYNSNAAFKPDLGPGQADRPLAMGVLFLIDDETMGKDHLSSTSISTQQILRFIALKHSASFAIISGLKSLISDEMGIITFLKKTTGVGTEPVSIYEDEGLKVTEIVHIKTLMPMGWDTWLRIELLAKAGFHTSTQAAKLLTCEQEFTELNLHYDNFLEKEGEVFDYLTPGPDQEELQKVDKTQTLSQILLEVQRDHYYA